jgi:LysR family nitrogen assimilation transcriptional regulator
MNLKQLKYFLRALEEGNITRAADKLNIAQTALGIQIRNLEDELGVPLLERHSRGVVATPAGELLAAHAERILGQVETARHEVMALGGPDQLPVYVGITPSIMRLVGDDMIERATKELSDVSLRLVEDFSYLLQDRLERDDLSYALTYNTPESGAYTRQPLLEEDLLFVTSMHDDDGTRTIPFAEAIRTELALNGKQDVVWHLVHQQAERLSLPVNIAYEVQSVRAIKNLVAKGVATSILPRGVATLELGAGQIIEKLVVRPRVTRTLFLVRSNRVPLGSRNERIEGFLRSIAHQLNAAVGENSRLL